MPWDGGMHSLCLLCSCPACRLRAILLFFMISDPVLNISASCFGVPLAASFTIASCLALSQDYRLPVALHKLLFVNTFAILLFFFHVLPVGAFRFSLAPVPSSNFPYPHHLRILASNAPAFLISNAFSLSPFRAAMQGRPFKPRRGSRPP